MGDAETKDGGKEEASDKVELKRELGFPGAVSMVIGSTIGSGIFISSSGVLHYTGSVALCLLFWVLLGFMSILTALCYSELGSMIPKSGGTYTYIKLGCGNPLAFCYIIQAMLFQVPGALVVMLRTCSRYLLALFPMCGSPQYTERMLTGAIMVGLFLINIRSSRMAARVMIFTTNAKVIALIVVIAGGLLSMIRGKTSELGTGFHGSKTDPTSLTLAYFACSWAFTGCENINTSVEEIKNPAKTLPRAQITGIIVVTVIYILTNMSYLTVLTRDEMLTSNATAVAWGERILGPALVLIPLSVALSTLGSGNSSLFSQTRVIFTAARDRNVPDVVSYIHARYLTPLVAITLTIALAISQLTGADVSDLIGYLEFLSAFFKGCVFFALLRFRYTLKHLPRPIKVNWIIPAFLLLIQAFLFVVPLALNPQMAFVWTALGVFAGSAILYLLFIKFKLSFPLYDRIVTWIQLTFEVVPPPDFDDDAMLKAKDAVN